MPDAQILLSRAPLSKRPALTVTGEVTLTLARVHEFCGPARRTLAVSVAAAVTGPVIWIIPTWMPERLNGEGLAPWIDPGRLLMVHAGRAEDILWSMEESLRSGAVPLVVAELPEPPALTPVRRLHLAAETGMAEGSTVPLGLILTAGAGGAPGIESRWHMVPDHPPAPHGNARTLWRLSRRRARSAAPADWLVEARGDARSRRLNLRMVKTDAPPMPPCGGLGV